MTSLPEIVLALKELKQGLITFHEPNRVYPQPNKQDLLLRIESYIELIVAAISRGEWPLELPVYGSDEKMIWRLPTQRRKCLLLFHLLAKSHALLRTNASSTKRDIYYEDVSLWGNQAALDNLVTQLTRLVGLPRRCLNIGATSKGLVAGSLTFLDANGRVIQCQTPNGVLIPNDVEKLSQFRSNAHLILVVEKDSTFQKLIDDRVERSIGDCILITAKGYPDVNTRRFLRRLWDELQLPPLALVDADPHGISIHCVYRFGSQVKRTTLEKKTSLTTPQLRYIGLQPTDIESLQIPDVAKLPLTARDRCLIDRMVNRPPMKANPLLCDQLMKLRQLDCKVEIQGLTKIHPQFLSRSYLPAKIQSMSWK
uniref:DNA topoisomerase (ATP-hydrolyzing) n=1 Tax=Scapholeberis mucronata TaxID=202097 RepID=A0A4Y7NNG7_9CRUS|nr:EOG090X09ZG [Scapholeberis mucronata]